MKICLATVHINRLFIPLSLLYIKAYLVEKLGIPFEQIEILEFPPDVEENEIVRQIAGTEPDIVGFSCYVWNVKQLMAASRRIKELRPNTKIVIGGPEVGPVGRSVLEKYPSIDVVVKSEGEIPFAEIVMQWMRDGLLLNVSGIFLRNGGNILETPDATILQDLNQLPSPHLPEYARHTGRVVCIETQRGCVFKCNFCFYNKDLSIRNRRFDLDRVKREILFWLERDVNEIYLMDPVFNLNSARAKEICRFVIEHNHRGVRFHAEVWAEFIDEELARLFHKAHFHFVEVGLQTTDDTALATVDRRLKMKQFMDGIGYLKRANVNFEVQLIYGLPGETVASFRRSLNFANRLEPSMVAVFPLMVLPGTELWHKAGLLRLNFDSEPPYFIRSHSSMTESDIDYGWRLVAALKQLGNLRTIRLLSKETNVTLSEILDAWIIWQGNGRAPESNGDDIQAFVLHFCESRQIPTEFYRASALFEATRASHQRAV